MPQSGNNNQIAATISPIIRNTTFNVSLPFSISIQSRSYPFGGIRLLSNNQRVLSQDRLTRRRCVTKIAVLEIKVCNPTIKAPTSLLQPFFKQPINNPHPCINWGIGCRNVLFAMVAIMFCMKGLNLNRRTRLFLNTAENARSAVGNFRYCL